MQVDISRLRVRRSAVSVDGLEAISQLSSQRWLVAQSREVKLYDRDLSQVLGEHLLSYSVKKITASTDGNWVLVEGDERHRPALLEIVGDQLHHHSVPPLIQSNWLVAGFWRGAGFAERPSDGASVGLVPLDELPTVSLVFLFGRQFQVLHGWRDTAGDLHWTNWKSLLGQKQASDPNCVPYLAKLVGSSNIVLLGTEQGDVEVWELERQRLLGVLPNISQWGRVSAIEADRDVSRIAVADEQGDVLIFGRAAANKSPLKPNSPNATNGSLKVDREAGYSELPEMSPLRDAKLSSVKLRKSEIIAKSIVG